MIDERGVSTSVNYVLTLGIATLLITGLLIAGGDFLADQRETTTRAEMEVISQQVAADLSSANRLAIAANGTGSFTLDRTLPEQVAGVSYVVEIESTAVPDGYGVVARTDTGVVVTANFTAESTIVTPQTFAGGDVRISWDATTDQIEVNNV